MLTTIALFTIIFTRTDNNNNHALFQHCSLKALSCSDHLNAIDETPGTKKKEKREEVRRAKKDAKPSEMRTSANSPSASARGHALEPAIKTGWRSDTYSPKAVKKP